MKGWKTKNKPKDPFEPTWDWKARKMADYCGPHGHRIIIYLGGIGCCRKCADLLIKKLQEKT